MIYNWIIGSMFVAALALLYQMYRNRKPMENTFESVSELLEKRYANSDISVEEYLEMKEMLKKKRVKPVFIQRIAMGINKF